MNPWIQGALLKDVRDRFARLYGPEAADRCVERYALLWGRYGVGCPRPADPRPWTERDAVLIAYGDMVRADDVVPLAALTRFLDERCAEVFSSVHVLPFCPSSSDDGFAVVHYRQVDPALGGWADLERIAAKYRLMADLVLNHVSRSSGWFGDFEMGIAPGCRYILSADSATDLSAVVRPRTHPLLTPVQTRGGVRHVWTTFSADQVDLDYANPDVLFEMLDILLYYISRGVRIVRLDAIAYLWKKPGTPCIHLPETHETVRILRDLVHRVAPDVWLITETNVPHAENVAYFGAGDEAHLVYQFSLPPLILHALTTGDASALTCWAAALAPPPPGCTFLNFTASHDGIGVRPLEGLVPPAEIDRLAAHVRARDGRVSSRSTAAGEQPYELNIAWFDALGAAEPEPPALHRRRFLCSQALALALPGIPAVYFNNLVAACNDPEGAARTGMARTIHRRKWTAAELDRRFADPADAASDALAGIARMLRVRAGCAAFHPDAPMRVLDAGPSFFAVRRGDPARGPAVTAVSNCTGRAAALPDAAAAGLRGGADLLGGDAAPWQDRALEPFETVWVESPAGGKS